MMIVSIAMTVYNGERFLAQQLESLLAQSRPPDQVVITDDSTNNLCEEVIRKFTAEYPDVIEYRHNDTPLGVNANFALAISMCHGDIIFLSDQDDVWLREKIEKMLKRFEREAVGGVFCNSSFIDADGFTIAGTLFEMRRFGTNNRSRMLKAGSLAAFAKDVYASGHNMAFRAQYKNLILPFPDLPGVFEDTWIGLAIAAVAEWSFVPECLTKHRRHDINESKIAAGSLKEQIAISRRALEAGHLQAKFNAIDAIKQRIPSFSASRQRLVDALWSHCYKRKNLPSSFGRRLPVIASEVFNLGYFRFSNGAKSILVDMFLR